METLHYCRKCFTYKPTSEFSKNGFPRKGIRNTCKKCANKYAYSQYHSNPDRYKEYKKKYYQDHKKDLNRKHEVYRKSHPDYVLRMRKKASEYLKSWLQTPSGRILRRIYSAKGKEKRRKESKNVTNNLTKNDVLDLLNIQCGRCARCQVKFSSQVPYTLDHVLPLSKGGGLTRSNIQLLCRPCNSSKGTKNILYRQLLPDEQ